MEYRKIGSLEVSVVGLGCNNFGRQTDEQESAKVVYAALDAGITFFDTADVYGYGRSQEILGKALKGHRERAVIATKFGVLREGQLETGVVDGQAPYLSPRGVWGGRPEYVRAAVERSLRELGVDYIDLFQMHFPDEQTPIAETLGALNELIDEGKVREVGCSNFTAEQLQEAATVGTFAHRFASSQNAFSLLDRRAEQTTLPACEELGIAFVPFWPLHGGLLTGKYRPGVPPPAGSRLAEPPDRRVMPKTLADRDFEIAMELDDFAQRRGHTVLELAFAWLLAHRAVASVIAGARTSGQIQSNANAASWVLTDEDLSDLGSVTASIGAG